jgi:hypothetical protein
MKTNVAEMMIAPSLFANQLIPKIKQLAITQKIAWLSIQTIKISEI